MSLISVDAVKDYLRARSTPFSSVTELTSGFGNFVFRVVQPDGKLIILKHAENYAKYNTAIPLSVTRMASEAKALSVFPTVLPSPETLKIQPATLFTHDAQENVLHLSDGGSRSLKDAYMDPGLDIPSIGARLGKWLAQFHASTKTTNIDDDTFARNIYRYCYDHVVESLGKYGLDPELGRKINEKYGSLLATDGGSCCHGDFWTGNIVIEDRTAQDKARRLTIVDWELNRRGCGATDVGQFAAEAWLLDHYRAENRGLRAAFMKAYREEVNPSAEFLKRAAVHFGCHLAYWPSSVSWGDHEQTKKIITVGAETMRRADAEEPGWLEDLELFRVDT